ncbi:MAG: MOSC N-terminal beta barrel domain-containing protein [Leptolyngbyaceae cyanobacterium bins.302]|nr:MOSC N-terminal beta barrel domain-containing protein [Leptolyngbyaceae cyanobacterium bins.302]
MPAESAFVAQLRLYPIKALNPVMVDRAIILPSGALAGDRAFAIMDTEGKFVNGKRNANIHTLRALFDLNTMSITLSGQHADPETFHIEQERDRLEAWLGKYFGFPVQIVQNLDLGFPDDTVSPGPTIVSTATLEAIATWFLDLTVEEIRLRFRANIEVAGVPPFWEDRLFGTEDELVHFQIGEVQFMGVNPCQRCVVVTRNPETGVAYPNFQKTFVAKRQDALPDWTNRSRFNHFFRLAVNTRVPVSEQGKAVHIGDEVKIYANDRRD